MNLYWRRFAISDIPVDDQKAFEGWIYDRWAEKDQLMKHFLETGKFPPFEYDANMDGVPIDGEKKGPKSHPAYIESQIRLGHWSEVGKIFAVLATLGVVTRLLF